VRNEKKNIKKICFYWYFIDFLERAAAGPGAFIRQFYKSFKEGLNEF